MRLLADAAEGRSAVAVDLTGPTVCELLAEEAEANLFARLGPDPLKTPGDAVGQEIFARVSRSRSPIGTLIMDQKVMAGVGNAYRSELLYRAGIDPRTPGRNLEQTRWSALWRDTVNLLEIGVKHQHILCVEPDFFGKAGYRDLARDERFWVYKRETCRRCGGPIEHFHLSNRSVYLCPAEQARLDEKRSAEQVKPPALQDEALKHKA